MIRSSFLSLVFWGLLLSFSLKVLRENILYCTNIFYIGCSKVVHYYFDWVGNLGVREQTEIWFCCEDKFIPAEENQ